MKGKYILIFKLKAQISLFKNSHEIEKEIYFPREADCSDLPVLHTPPSFTQMSILKIQK